VNNRGLSPIMGTYLYSQANPLRFTDRNGLCGVLCPILPWLPEIGAGLEQLIITGGASIAMSQHSSGDAAGSRSNDKPQQCKNSDDDKCDKRLEVEEALCKAIAGPRYPGNPNQAVAICQKAAFQRYIKCRQGVPESEWPPLTGVDTPI